MSDMGGFCRSPLKSTPSDIFRLYLEDGRLFLKVNQERYQIDEIFLPDAVVWVYYIEGKVKLSKTLLDGEQKVGIAQANEKGLWARCRTITK